MLERQFCRFLFTSMRHFIMALCSLPLLFMCTEYVGWVLSIQRLKGIRGCLFPVVRVDRIEPDTPQPSAFYFSYSLPNSSTSKPPFFELSMGAAAICLSCRAYLSHLCLR